MEARNQKGEKVELVAGMWYVGVEVIDQEPPRYGVIAQYVGDGEFYDDDKYDPQEVQMQRHYDYVLEQNMGSL
jgi:hypothetical protein